MFTAVTMPALSVVIPIYLVGASVTGFVLYRHPNILSGGAPYWRPVRINHLPLWFVIPACLLGWWWLWMVALMFVSFAAIGAAFYVLAMAVGLPSRIYRFLTPKRRTTQIAKREKVKDHTLR